jgi:hypothetical protein
VTQEKHPELVLAETGDAHVPRAEIAPEEDA